MEKMYECTICGSKKQVSDDSHPECCGKPMQEIIDQACRDAGPEAARPMKAEEPCEDFTGSQA